jgi:hypothetical protein
MSHEEERGKDTRLRSNLNALLLTASIHLLLGLIAGVKSAELLGINGIGYSKLN